MQPADDAPSTLKDDGIGSVSLARLLLAFLKIGSIGLRWHPAFVPAVGAAAGYFRLLP